MIPIIYMSTLINLPADGREQDYLRGDGDKGKKEDSCANRIAVYITILAGIATLVVRMLEGFFI